MEPSSTCLEWVEVIEIATREESGIICVMNRWAIGCLIAALAASGCVKVSTEPIRIEPVYIEITINHKVQKELDDLFAELDQASQAAEYVPYEEGSIEEDLKEEE